jgi:hypothetical protein
MFCDVWTREAEMAPQSASSGHAGRVFATAIPMALVSAYAFEAVFRPADLAGGVKAGLVAGGCFVAASFGVNYAFAQRGWKLWMIDGGWHTVQFTIYGVVLGLWS